MKKLILISALFIFNNSYGSVTIDEYIKSLGDDEIPKKASQGVYPGQYLPQYLYNLSYRQPEVADIVCIISSNSDGAPFEIHIAYDDELENMIWLKEVSAGFYQAYSKDGGTSGDKTDNVFADYTFRSRSGVMEIEERLQEREPNGKVSPIYLHDRKYSISIYTSKVSYSENYPKFLKTHQSMGDCTFIKLPKILEDDQDDSNQPKSMDVSKKVG